MNRAWLRFISLAGVDVIFADNQSISAFSGLPALWVFVWAMMMEADEHHLSTNTYCWLPYTNRSSRYLLVVPMIVVLIVSGGLRGSWPIHPWVLIWKTALQRPILNSCIKIPMIFRKCQVKISHSPWNTPYFFLKFWRYSSFSLSFFIFCPFLLWTPSVKIWTPKISVFRLTFYCSSWSYSFSFESYTQIIRRKHNDFGTFSRHILYQFFKTFAGKQWKPHLY